MTKKPVSIPKREDIPAEDTWRLEDIFATDEVWEQEFQSLKKEIPRLLAFKGKLGDSAQTLLQAFQTNDNMSMRLGKLYTYAHMRNDQDTTNSTYQALHDRAYSLYVEFSSALSYMTPELLTIDEKTIASFIEENKDLQIYKKSLDELNLQRDHVLSEKEEKLLAEASEVMGASNNTYDSLNDADLTFTSIQDENGHTVEITHGNYGLLMESQDRRVRQDAFKSMYDSYEQFQNTFASTLSATVKKHNFYAKTRNYESARDYALSGNKIPETVYDQLVKTINQHLDLSHRYMKIRKEMLGLETLHMYDLHVPLMEDVEMKYTYKEAQNVLVDALSVMGEDYTNILKEAYENRWVDVQENKGKRSGAYSSGTYGTNPYILMNWKDNVDNLFTLAHEFGHSVHSYYTRKHQPYIYGDYSIFVAEVASTCNEALLNDYLLKHTTDPKQRLFLLNHYLDGFRGTVFRQTMFAEFEHLIHEKAQAGESLTAETLTNLYYNLNKKYFGEHVESDKEIGFEWARIPHFYYNYYVYQYATGFSAATSLSKQILEEGKPAVDRYITEFLQAGSSDFPIEVLKKAGVDMTTPKPIEEALAVFEQRLNEFEELLQQVKA